MEHGYFHPDRGYWQTTNEPPQHILDGYPEGTVEVPVKPSGLHEWDGSQWVEVLPDPAKTLDVERQNMQCTPRQGKLAIGPIVWNKVEKLVSDMMIQYADDPSMYWGIKVVIEDTTVWKRNDPDMQMFIWAMDLTEEEADDLFRLAMTL